MESRPRTRKSQHPTSQGRARLEVTQGKVAGQRIYIDREVYIGRTQDQFPDVDSLCLPDPQVSRVHARVLRRGHGYVIEDMNSTNGTFVDGKRLDPRSAQRLDEGTRLRIGSHRLRFHCDAVVETTMSLDRAELELPLPVPGSQSVAIDSSLPLEMSHMFDARSMLLQPPIDAAVASGELDTTLRRLRAMTRISLELGTLRNREELLSRIMDYIFDLFPAAERAFVLLRTDGELEPVSARRRDGGEVDTGRLSLSQTIVDEVLTNQKAVLSINAMEDRRYREQESVLLHSLRSVMCAPLLVGDEVLGLIQVDTSDRTVDFSQDELELLAGVSVQAAIAVKNSQLYDDIENLFEGFVSASVQAIEARDPITAGHSFRVATYTERLAVALDRADTRALRDVTFDAEQLREIRFAALLHDFGKVGVREKVLTKPTKLYPEELAIIRERFGRARAHVERHGWRELVEQHGRSPFTPAEFTRRRHEIEVQINGELERLDRFLDIVLMANRPAITDETVDEALDEVVAYTFATATRADLRLLTQAEHSNLLLSRGSLNPDERREIESHVSHTLAFLRLIPWTRNLARLPEIANGHHEKLDGSGYPHGNAAESIPVETRILTIADIYDALTASDRPYKKSVPTERALDILRLEARENKIDDGLLDVFIESEAYLPADR